VQGALLALAASKFESRNSKFETNPKFEYSNIQSENPRTCGFDHLNLVHLRLFRISCFGFRIYFAFDLKLSTGYLQPATCNEPLYRKHLTRRFFYVTFLEMNDYSFSKR